MNSEDTGFFIHLAYHNCSLADCGSLMDSEQSGPTLLLNHLIQPSRGLMLKSLTHAEHSRTTSASAPRFRSLFSHASCTRRPLIGESTQLHTTRAHRSLNQALRSTGFKFGSVFAEITYNTSTYQPRSVLTPGYLHILANHVITTRYPTVQ